MYYIIAYRIYYKYNLPWHLARSFLSMPPAADKLVERRLAYITRDITLWNMDWVLLYLVFVVIMLPYSCDSCDIFTLFVRVSSLALGQSYDCPNAREETLTISGNKTLKNMDKLWWGNHTIYQYQRGDPFKNIQFKIVGNPNTTKQNKTKQSPSRYIYSMRFTVNIDDSSLNDPFLFFKTNFYPSCVHKRKNIAMATEMIMMIQYCGGW